MKIGQLPIGARFQWKDRSYIKVGPMTAVADDGGVDFNPGSGNYLPIGPVSLALSPGIVWWLRGSVAT